MGFNKKKLVCQLFAFCANFFFMTVQNAFVTLLLSKRFCSPSFLCFRAMRNVNELHAKSVRFPARTYLAQSHAEKDTGHKVYQRHDKREQGKDNEHIANYK